MPSDNTLSFTHLIIPVLGLTIPIVAVLAHYLAQAYRDRLRHLTIREFVRAGQPVPPELLALTRDSVGRSAAGGGDSPTRILLPAVVNIGLGLGLMGLFAVASPGSWWWGIGLLPLCLGLGLLALWAALRREAAQP